MKRLTTEKFVERAKSIHGDVYGYSQVHYVNMNTNVSIQCQKHGLFEQTPNNHLKGHGCPMCTKVEARRMPIDSFVANAISVHGNKYDYSQVVYVNSKTKVKILCPVHRVFEQTPYKHLAGQGCPYCAPNHKDDTKSFIRKARAVHGDRYDYSKTEYVDQHTKVWIIDKETGHMFQQQPNSHLNGRGDYARRIARIQAAKRDRHGDSDYEAYVYQKLTNLFGADNVKRDYWSERYPYACDFYVVPFNLYIELNIHSTHGGHFYNPLDPHDMDCLRRMREKSDDSEYYRRRIAIWTGSDIEKRDAAIRNGLNYLVFWDAGLLDFDTWFDDFRDGRRVFTNVSL